jgi:hypothetical protein
MSRDPSRQRNLQLGDIPFAAFLAVYAAVSVSLIPFDFTDLCYLFSLEQRRWVTQEWVHPIYVPLLRLFAGVVGLFGYRGHMLVPVEVLNVVAATAAFACLYLLARRFPRCSLTAAVMLAVAALSTGFWSATLRSTPYALAFLCQSVSLSLLISESPVRPRRYALAGAFAGLAMGLHAAAMALGVVGVTGALLEPDPARTARGTIQRIACFGGAMLALALIDWTVFLAANHIGIDYFSKQDFQSTWAGIEQVPGRSVYTNPNWTGQFTDFVEMASYQVGVLLRVCAILLPLALLVRRWWATVATPMERRLTIAAVANFAGIAGFFAINGSHNGFIFASTALAPVLLATALHGSYLGLAAVLYLAVPGTVENVHHMLQAGAQGANDPQLAEVRYLEQTLGPRDVLLTPGSPFPEMLYLSHLNVFEVSANESTHSGSEVPVVHPGPTLQARIAWWRAHGSRVFYALGDDSTDFAGDISGVEKEHQIFWRPETAARDRAKALQAIRTALEASSLEARDGLVSLRGEHYAEIHPTLAAEPQPPPSRPPALTTEELRAVSASDPRASDHPLLPRRAQYLGELAAAIPGDPWFVCDVMDLVCAEDVEVRGESRPCEPIAGCDESVALLNGLRARMDGPTGRAPEEPHLTPEVGRMVQSAAGNALQPLLDRGFTVTRLDINGDAIELEVEDADKHAHEVTLALRGSKRSAKPDGTGRQFVFYLSDPRGGADPAAHEALLATAARLDAAVPESALKGD